MPEEAERRDVLLIAADLGERRLLYGELLEAGYDVQPVSGLAVALGGLLQKSLESRLILLDVHDDSDATPQSVQHLLSLSPLASVIVVAGLTDQQSWEALRSSNVELLTRPIAIGKIVDVVKQTLRLRNAKS